MATIALMVMVVDAWWIWRKKTSLQVQWLTHRIDEIDEEEHQAVIK